MIAHCNYIVSSPKLLHNQSTATSIEFLLHRQAAPLYSCVGYKQYTN